MKQIQNFEIVLDADDVLLDCNAYALRLLEERDRRSYSLDNVTAWGRLNIPEDERLSFLLGRSFYETQPPLPGAEKFLKKLLTMANVTIMTAVYPQFMGERIERLSRLFPFFPVENIIMGKRKEMLRSDVMLDDGAHNLQVSGATLPVLFRQPWNRGVSGICSVNSYDEFLSLIAILQGNRREKSRFPKILCIVGPSGSGKHELAEALCQRPDFSLIRTCTTAPGGQGHHLSRELFARYRDEGRFLESTYYCCEQYALPRVDIDTTLANGQHAVAVMDISGCMAVYNHYPGQSLILYADRDKRSCVMSILEKEGLSREHQAERILSIELEQKNRVLADRIIPIPQDGDWHQTVDEIRLYLDA